MPLKMDNIVCGRRSTSQRVVEILIMAESIRNVVDTVVVLLHMCFY